MLNLRGGIPRPIGDFPESLSQAMLVGIMLVGRLGVHHHLLHDLAAVLHVALTYDMDNLHVCPKPSRRKGVPNWK